MKVNVTLRYLRRTLVEIKTEEELPDGTKAGELSARIIREHEQQEGIVFRGASIVTLCNGRIVTEDHLLQDGDEIQIMPVAAAG